MKPTQVVQCRRCGRRNDDHHDPRRPADTPAPGDVSLCASCLSVNVLEEGPHGSLVGRQPTADEFDRMLADPHVVEILLAVHRVRQGQSN